MRIRGREFVAARDNVLFELGLFIGRLGRERTFLVMPKGQTDFRIATDLVGLHPASFDPDRSDGNLRAAVGPACNSIRNRIRQVGPLLRPSASKKVHELSGPTLLVADDDMKAGDLIFNQIRRLVGRRAGVLLVNDPVEACELLRTGAPVIACITDMVFRDHSPLSGVQIAEAANRRGLPVVIATSHAREHLGLAIAELSRIGIPESSIFTKPLTVDQNRIYWDAIGAWIDGTLA